jgi:UDP-N-acetylmuramate dehydrogenase
MGVGGPARWYIPAQTESDVRRALEWAHAHSVPVHVLGGGSNVVIADQGIDGLVIHLQMKGIERGERDGRVVYQVGAGEPWDPFVAETVSSNFSGLECLSGIPGLVGGTPVQNVGAYGQDVSETITRVHVIDRRTRSPRVFSNADCAFGYRTSRFKHADAEQYIVTAVEFSLNSEAPPRIEYADVVAYFEAAGIVQPALQDVREAVIAIRRRKGMVIEADNAARHSCGSFFVNPVVTSSDLERVQSLAGVVTVPHYAVDAGHVKIPAAWLIERAGFPKGTTRGPVGISPYQAQAIINRGGARAIDVVELATEVKRAVWDMFAISIVPEPVFVGFSQSPELRFLLTHQRSH